MSSGERYAAAAGAEQEYRLGAGDKIRIIVYNEIPLSGEFQVGAKGTVSLPLIGEVPATGRTPGEVAAEAQTRLAAGFLQSPRVSAEISAYRPFYILGEVARAGQYPYVPGLTALAAVATAQGFTPRSDQRVIYIKRENEQTETAYKLSPSLQIYPGDTVRIKERWF